MTTDVEAKFPYLLLVLALGAAGLVAAMLSRKETRAVIRERSGKSLDYLNQQAGKLRETADLLVQQGKKLIDCKGSDGSLSLRLRKSRLIKKTNEKTKVAESCASRLARRNK